MIIDNHCHLIAEGWYPNSVILGIAAVMRESMGKSTGVYLDAADLAASVMPILVDATGEKLVASMDAAGVDTSCVFGVDYGLATKEDSKVPIEDQNRTIAEVASRSPDRLVAFFTIDPRRPNGLEMFQRAVEDWKMRGLKLYPPTGFFPHDSVCYPYYEKCLEYGIPVLFHTGILPAPLKSRFGQPMHLDDVAADFPDLSIIMAHVGLSAWHEALEVVAVKPNVYLDFSGWQVTCLSNPSEFYRMLRRVLNVVGPWRVFFGSDGPILNPLLPLDRWVEAVKNPDLSSCSDISFSNEEKEIILGKAFARLMKLK
jgi:predicted TIM-barrel fold metal-dependent hydrolase